MFMKMMVAFMNMMMMVVLIMVMVMVIVFKILRSQFKNQVRDLESNQTLIAKPFPELVTSRLAINHEDDDDDIDDDDEGQDNVKIMIMV